MTDSNQAVLTAQAAVQGLVDALGERDAALAAANVQVKLQADALAEMRAQNDVLSQANLTLQASNDALQSTIAALRAQLAAANTITAQVTAGALANAAIQAAIDKAQPGQTVKVPAGAYLLDGLNPPVLKGGVDFDFTGAVFSIVPNSSIRYYGFKTGGAGGSVKGGEIIGDRLKHTYTAGSTHEWGCGLMAAHDDWSVEGMTCRQMTGDGFGVTGNRVKLSKCIGTQNRRQALSVYGCNGFRGEDCEFTFTGAYMGQAGTTPMGGVDFEPDPNDPTITDAKLSRCKLYGNRANVLAWLRADVPGTLDVTLEDCIFDDPNQPTGYVAGSNGLWAKDEAARAGSINLSLVRTSFGKHSGNSVKADAGSVVKVGDGGQTNANSFNRGAVLHQGIATKYDIAQLGNGKALTGWNKYPA